jgi:predicted protein tyrosine phosphatase
MQIDTKLKLLFVCTVNRMRSATAHKIYESDDRFEVKSAGTDKSANTVLTEEILNWADSIVVMEKHHRNHIRKHNLYEIDYDIVKTSDLKNMPYDLYLKTEYRLKMRSIALSLY